MIIEEEKKVEIIDDLTKESNNKNNQFKQVQEENSKSHKHLFWVLGIFFTVFLVILILLFSVFTFYNYKNNTKISTGIYINNINVSKLSKQEAQDKIEEYYQNQLSNDITLVYGDYTSYIKTSEIGLSYDTQSAIDYAYKYGKTNNIFSDNYALFNAIISGVNITPTLNYDKNALQNILTSLSAELPDAVVESGYYIEGQKLIITKGKDGNIIDIEKTLSELEPKLINLGYVNEVIEIKTQKSSPKEIDLNAVYSEVHKDAKNAYYTKDPWMVYPSENGIDFGISLDDAKQIIQTSENECEIPLKVLYPDITTNMIGQEAFPDLLASFSTKYASSNTNRTTNLRLAANKIDGCVLVPGETFSYNSIVGKRTIAAGYKEAAVYENGAVVQGLGGGICQISTTLYNAALLANLEMVELYNHQFVPSYVTAGRDATVVYGVKDFKFKNSRKHAIKITCSVSKGVATFQIWGVKEETEYDVNVYATVTSRTSSYIKSSTYRTLKLNGEVVKNENIINSTYKVH